MEKIRIVGEIAVVTATAEFHPLRQINKLASELDAVAFEGLVLFDLLAVNGLAENRFASMVIHNGDFDRASFSLKLDVSPAIKSEQDSMAKRDISFLRSTVLSSSEIENFIH